MREREGVGSGRLGLREANWASSEQSCLAVDECFRHSLVQPQLGLGASADALRCSHRGGRNEGVERRSEAGSSMVRGRGGGVIGGSSRASGEGPGQWEGTVVVRLERGQRRREWDGAVVVRLHRGEGC